MPPTVSEKIQAYLATNAELSKSWPKMLTMPEMRIKGQETGGAVAVLTCLDPRCAPEQVFGQGFGPAFRNAGGKATPNVVSSMVILRSLANLAGVIVMHHTDSGVFHLIEPDLRAESKARTPDAAADIDAMEFGCLPSEAFESSIIDDVKKLRAEKALKGVEIRGMALDTFMGVVREIEV